MRNLRSLPDRLPRFLELFVAVAWRQRARGATTFFSIAEMPPMTDCVQKHRTRASELAGRDRDRASRTVARDALTRPHGSRRRSVCRDGESRDKQNERSNQKHRVPRLERFSGGGEYGSHDRNTDQHASEKARTLPSTSTRANHACPPFLK